MTVGFERAKGIRDFYGRLPLAWTGTLTDVPGVGEKTAKRLESLLGG